MMRGRTFAKSPPPHPLSKAFDQRERRVAALLVGMVLFFRDVQGPSPTGLCEWQHKCVILCKHKNFRYLYGFLLYDW